VDDAVVQRSNRIHQRLQAAVSPAQQRELAALPMWMSATVGGMRVGIVHGDAQSLAGWGFAQELWAQASHRAQLREWFEQAGVDAFACSHTCLPLFGQLRLAGQRSGWVLNNGAAGMPNFRGDPAGLFTRMARLAAPADVARSVRAQACWVPPSQSAPAEPVHLQALALEVDATQVQARFVAQWPPGSDAHASYFSRIAQGPDYRASQIVRQDTPLEIDTCSPS
jgi:hypothetical protein